MMISKHFKRHEFACRCGCGFDAVDVELLNVLEDIRDILKKPVIIVSGNRCESHNKDVGGVLNSMHTKGMAVDFFINGIEIEDIVNYLSIRFQDKYGIGRYSGWVHLDVRSDCARWNG